MKREVKRILKEKCRTELFSDNYYELVVQNMNLKMKHDMWLKNYLGLDPLNKAQWVADHMILFNDQISTKA